MLNKKLAFKGNYQTEFGGNHPRIWRAFSVFNNGTEVGSLYEEPTDYPERYHVYRGGFETTGERVGEWYKTSAGAMAALASKGIK